MSCELIFRPLSEALGQIRSEDPDSIAGKYRQQIFLGIAIEKLLGRLTTLANSLGR
jgi:hypothetical protein